MGTVAGAVLVKKARAPLLLKQTATEKDEVF
jgi:hypothetical protein